MIAGTIRFLFTNFSLTFFLAGLSCALIKIYRHRINVTRAFIAEAFTSYYLWSLGIMLIYNAAMHIAFPGIPANYIGWANNPFRLEVGFASLGFGIAALLAVKKNFKARLVTVIATSVFLWGCAAGYLYQITYYHDSVPGNAGFMLWVELIQPLISIILLTISYSFEKKEKPLQLIKYSASFFIAIPAAK